MTDAGPRTPAELLRAFGLRPKKSWGQNFLADDGVLERIAHAACIDKADAVVEIGPGLGHLTRHLLATGAAVTAIERDRDMAVVLRKTLPAVRLIEADAVEADYAGAAGASSVVLVGNLPYHLTSPILFRVLELWPSVRRAVMTVQKEVADRLAASPGNREYGLLTVLLGLRFDIEKLFNISSRAFYPPPNVDSAVIRLARRATPRAEISDEAHFRRVVKAAFSQRRKTLQNSLRSMPELGDRDVVSAALVSAGIDGQRRAETLSVEEFAALERSLFSHAAR